MDIETLADLLRKQLVIRYRPNQDEQTKSWYCYFESCEVREGQGMLASLFGNGDNPTEAVHAYAKEIAGKLLIFNAMGSDRMEFQAPLNLT